MINALLRGARKRNPKLESAKADPRTRCDFDAPEIQPADVVRAYRLLLSRSPENDAVIDDWVAARLTPTQLYDGIIRSAEFFTRRVAPSHSSESSVAFSEPALRDLFSRFEPYRGVGQEGFVTDFLGVRTRIEFIEGILGMDGVVEGLPIPGNFHAEALEWAGVLRAVCDATDHLTAIELGAGWGPWLVACAIAAGKKGIQKVNLVGVDAVAGHVDFMHRHFLDNGLNPDDHVLLHGVAGAKDGHISFPAVDQPGLDYSATIEMDDPLLPRTVYSKSTELRMYSLNTLIAPHKLVDLVHIDVQGSEREVVLSSLAILSERVRWMVIGTHGRAIEQALLEGLHSSGWVLEADQSCRYASHQGKLLLDKDGCQIWRNPNL
jgi:FkbM family methyltransferase